MWTSASLHPVTPMPFVRIPLVPSLARAMPGLQETDYLAPVT